MTIPIWSSYNIDMKNKEELYKLTIQDIENIEDYDNLIRTDLIYKFLEKNKITKYELCKLAGIKVRELNILLSDIPTKCFDWAYQISDVIGTEGGDIFNL